jgi:hypothetical protein
LEEDGFRPKVENFNQIIRVLGKQQDFEMVQTWYKKLLRKCRPDTKTVAFLMEMYLRHDDVNKAYLIFNMLVVQEGTIPPAEATSMLVMRLLTRGCGKSAEGVLALIQPKVDSNLKSQMVLQLCKFGLLELSTYSQYKLLTALGVTESDLPKKPST